MKAPPGRLLPLDFLRAVAVLLVMGAHLPVHPNDTPFPVTVPFQLWARCGWVGVDLFFVLSGFLVSGLLFREYRQFNEIRFGRFFLRRGLKIYPAFYAFLAITIVVKGATTGLPALRNVLSEAFFVQNYFSRLWTHTWSLALEEHFYLFVPLLLIALTRWRREGEPPFVALPRVFFAIAATLLLLRVGNAFMREFSRPTHFYPTHLRIDSLLFGVVLSYFYHYHSERFFAFSARWRNWLFVFGLALLSPTLIFRYNVPFVYTIGFTLAYVGSGMLIVAALTSHFSEGALFRAIAYIGLYSYSIYLWHLPVALWGVPRLQSTFGGALPATLLIVAYVLGSIGVGILMARLIELPVLQLRDRLFPSRSRALPPAEASTFGAEPPAADRVAV